MEYIGKQKSDDIVDRLARIETKLDAFGTSVQEHNRIFHGEGDNKGLLIEHAQLMASHKTWKWVFSTVLGAVSAVLADVIVRGHF